MVAKAEKVEKVSRLAGPAGEKVDKTTGEVTALAAGEIRLVLRGWELTQQIEALESQLAEVKQALLAAHGSGASLRVAGVCTATLAERETVKIVDAERLAAVLGERFSDLVRAQATYKPEKRLIEMAADGDEPLAPAIRACLEVARSESVSYRPDRKA